MLILEMHPSLAEHNLMDEFNAQDLAHFRALLLERRAALEQVKAGAKVGCRNPPSLSGRLFPGFWIFTVKEFPALFAHSIRDIFLLPLF